MAFGVSLPSTAEGACQESQEACWEYHVGLKYNEVFTRFPLCRAPTVGVLHPDSAAVGRCRRVSVRSIRNGSPN